MAIRRHRSISHTEISTSLTCQAQWDFKYGGRLAGSTLKPKGVKPHLSAGRAWGAGVAVWHSQASTNLLAELDALAAMRDSLAQDYDRMEEMGVVMDGVTNQRVDLEDMLERVFGHYTATCNPLPNLTKIEEELDVPILSRNGTRPSSMYRFQGFLDGFTIDPKTGYEWLVEFKFRGRLSSHEMLLLSRQHLHYAWARQRQTGRPVIGVLSDERLSEFPKAPRLKQAAKGDVSIDGYTVSHAKDQMTTANQYVEACRQFEVPPKASTVQALADRRWQQRYPITFTPSELREAGLELVSAAETIRDLDAGRYPVRNARPQICNSCDFRKVCKNPSDRLFVDLLFERTVPKRLRELAGEVPKDRVVSNSGDTVTVTVSATEPPGNPTEEMVF